MERRLAAIFAADVVGYSRLMGDDEAGTLQRLKSLHKELVQPKIAARKGRIVKLMGDGLLAIIDGVLSDDLESLDDWTRKLCGLGDEITTDAKLSESSVKSLVDHYGGYDETSKAILVMAWFNMLSRFVDSTGVPIEEAPDPYAGIARPASVVE
jgi:class 3 adenylate cyclase